MIYALKCIVDKSGDLTTRRQGECDVEPLIRRDANGQTGNGEARVADSHV